MSTDNRLSAQIQSAVPGGLASVDKPHRKGLDIDWTPSELSTADETRDDLTATNEPDPMLNDQTWPSEQDNREGAFAEQPRTKRVPKGTSAYQAAWIVDDEEEDGLDDDEEEMSQDGIGDGSVDADVGIIADVEETEEIELDSRRSELHRDLDDEEEEQE